MKRKIEHFLEPANFSKFEQEKVIYDEVMSVSLENYLQTCQVSYIKFTLDKVGRNLDEQKSDP